MAAKLAYSAKDMNGQKILNLANGTAAQDAAAYGQVQAAQSAAQAYTDAAVAGLASGQVLKGSVRAAVSTNVNLASPGATLDGVAAANGDIFLLTAQTTGSEGGPYVFNGPTSPMTRATNWDTQAEAVLGSYWIVREGSQADKFALLTNDAFTLGTTTPTFTFFSAIAGGAYNSIAVAVPATASGGTGTVTHNLNTRNVGVQVVRVVSPYDEVEVRVERNTVNTVDVKPDADISAGQFIALIWKVG